MNKLRVSVINLGCPKNRIDAEIILGSLAQAGYLVTDDTNEAEVVIINTCAFIEEAIEESAAVIEEYESLRRKGMLRKLLVTGCLSQRNTTELCGRFPWVDAFIGLDSIPDIPRIIKEINRQGEVYVYAKPVWNPAQDQPRLLSTPQHYAYLRLAEGCSNHCSYCTIPSIRGDLRLRSVDGIIEEAVNLVNIGVKELILIAQDTTAHTELTGILEQLENIDGLRWIRLLYSHPAHVTEKLIEQMVKSKKILNYMDMPIQHLADSVLKRMNRRILSSRIKEIVKTSREFDPDFVLRTTVMVGFPGETDLEYQELVNGLEELEFTHLGIFAYSAEEGTNAATMEGAVEKEVVKERIEILIDLAEKYQTRDMKKKKGTIQEAVVDFITPDSAVGRLWSSAPEIDRLLEITNPGDIAPGTFTRVEITGGKDDVIVARRIESA
ncbi:30S ribosomal protein S12 methylthiotransferase RimO [bacterium]|nr:30S ribosomal protein S12 methylthiotransferase RimO [bacterium]